MNISKVVVRVENREGVYLDEISLDFINMYLIDNFRALRSKICMLRMEVMKFVLLSFLRTNKQILLFSDICLNSKRVENLIVTND